MNKTKLYITSLLLAAASLNVGCMSSVSSSMNGAYSTMKNSFSSNKKISAETEALYSQVSQQDKDQVDALQHELEVTRENKILAQLVSKRDQLKQKRSALDDKRLKVLADEKIYRIKLAKLEAIDRNQLGDKITNIEAIADVHVDALETQQKRLKLDSEIGVLDVHIENLNSDIDTQQDKVNELTGDLEQTNTDTHASSIYSPLH